MSHEHRHALPVGQEIEGYRIEGILGFGGFGITYLATDQSLNRKVAIKEYLPSGQAARSAEGMSVHPLTQNDVKDYYWGLERFREEAETLVNFHHPNIVQIHRFFEANSTAYLVMQFVDGQNLDQILTRTRTMPESDVVRFLVPILDGLHEVHKAGFLHRDVKPANIYIRSDGSPILLDFSAARHQMRNDDMTAIVSDGYAPYEQYGSGGQLGPWTDIYGLGAVLYRCVTGQRPTPAPDRLAAAVNQQPDPLVPAALAARGRYGEKLLKAIDEAIRIFEKDRPQTAAAVRGMIDMHSAKPKSFSREAREISKRLTEEPPPPPALAKLLSRERRPIVILVAAAIFLVTGIGGFLLGRTVSSSPNTTSSGTPPSSERETKVAEAPPANPESPATPPAPTPVINEGASPNDGAGRAMPEDKPAEPNTRNAALADCEQCPEMVAIRVAAGFVGSPANEAGRDAEEPLQREVKLAKSFALARTETTRAQFEAFVKATGFKPDADGCYIWHAGQWLLSRARHWRDPGFAQTNDDPVVCVSAKDAEAYAAWLAKTTGKKYRLPTETEWEIAARGGSGELRSWGSDVRELCQHANGADDSAKGRHADWGGAPCQDGHVYTAPVGRFRANAFGLYDMIGNVAEWTSDCWRGYAPQTVGANDAGASTDCGRRVVRGGAFNYAPRLLRSAARIRAPVNGRIFNLGFRVARDME